MGRFGWRRSVTEVWANDYSTGEAIIDVFGPGWNSQNPGIIGGNYTVFLQAYNAGQGNVSLWQNGMIPPAAKSLEYSAWNLPSANQVFSVTFSGNVLSPIALASGQSPSGQSYTVYGVNVAPYAGETGQLEFTAYGGQGPNWIELDDISFSPTAVPEPGIAALLTIGAMIFGAHRWWPRPDTKAREINSL